MNNRRQSPHFIIPPHVFYEVIRKGSPNQRNRAISTLTMSEQARGQRQLRTQMCMAGVVTPPEKHRVVYDGQCNDTLPGEQVRGEGDPATSDKAVNEAYEGSGATYDLYREVYDRHSIDDNRMDILSTVHYLQGYDNAFWDGKQMVYGDGDEDLPENERLFNRFTIAVDVIGHELTHGVIQYEAKLDYWSQAGALNESFSDVFGSLVKQRKLSQTADQADWLIGAGLFTYNVKGEALRSMKDPGTAYDDPVIGKDPQPGHMDNYRDLPPWNDNGGVHINSGIPNHAFYYAATEIGGYAWEKAGLIWYITLRDRLRWKANFQNAANLTCLVAGEIYGSGSMEQQAVRNGWSRVGIKAREESKVGAGQSEGLFL